MCEINGACECGGACGTKATEPVVCNADLPGYIQGGKEAFAWIQQLEAKKYRTPEEDALLAQARDVYASVSGCWTAEDKALFEKTMITALKRSLGGPHAGPLAAALLTGTGRRDNRAKARQMKERVERRQAEERAAEEAALAAEAAQREFYELSLRLAEHG